MDLPTDPDARIMALHMLGWRLVMYTSGINGGEPRYYGRRADADLETFTSDSEAEAWEWAAETETGKRTPFSFPHGPA